jgi:heme oxygenase
VPDLVRDLDFLNVDMTLVPLCPDVPDCDTLPAALGNLYVREGAALGGQYISRYLENVLGLSAGNGYRFFSSAGRNVGHQWKQFQGLLLLYSSRETDDEVIRAARSAFELIRIWLCQT